MAVAARELAGVEVRQPRRLFARRRLTGLWFVLPAVAFITVFFFVLLVMAVWVSFHDWPLFGATTFAGLDNYATLFQDEAFRRGLWFTTQYALLVTPPIFVLGFGLALLVNRGLPGIGFLRTVFFLPTVVGFAAACLLWFYMLNDQIGVINDILRRLGMIGNSLLWFANYNTALLIIIVMVVWKTVGGTMLLLLIGMQSIPSDLYEAAKVDGAGAIDRLRTITLPLLKRTFALALVLSITGSYLAFDQFYILTRGGPRNQTTSIVYEITNTAFNAFDLGYATTMSIALLVVLVVLSAVQIFLLRDSTQF
ncbi:MAG: sugar ABC transporter permease [Chloroflexota bacterium]|nr:sugar ABC transporter permease [Chloroflexota bacterium]